MTGKKRSKKIQTPRRGELWNLEFSTIGWESYDGLLSVTRRRIITDAAVLVLQTIPEKHDYSRAVAQVLISDGSVWWIYYDE